jgi:hypothetical protein
MPKESRWEAGVASPAAHFLAASANSSIRPDDWKFFSFFLLLISLVEIDVGGEHGRLTPTYLSPEVAQCP